MLIESILRRPGGTIIELDDVRYHFVSNDEGRHVTEVDDEDHIGTLLAIAEGYRLYRAKRVAVASASTGVGLGLAPVESQIEHGSGEGAGQVSVSIVTETETPPAKLPVELPAKPPETPLAKPPVTADTPREELMRLYEVKFGEKAHPRIKIETLVERLNDD